MVEGYKRLIKKGELVDDFQDFTWLLFLFSKCFQSGVSQCFLVFAEIHKGTSVLTKTGRQEI